MLTLYKNIHYYRTLNKMTQQDLADKLGYDRSMISRIEAGRVDLSQSKIMEIAKIFGITASELMGDDGVFDEAEIERQEFYQDLANKKKKDDLLLRNYHLLSEETRTSVDLLIEADLRKHGLLD